MKNCYKSENFHENKCSKIVYVHDYFLLCLALRNELDIHDFSTLHTAYLSIVEELFELNSNNT